MANQALARLKVSMAMGEFGYVKPALAELIQEAISEGFEAIFRSAELTGELGEERAHHRRTVRAARDAMVSVLDRAERVEAALVVECSEAKRMLNETGLSRYREQVERIRAALRPPAPTPADPASPR